MSFTYPAAPANASDDILRPSAAFKGELTKVVVSLVLFMCLYLVLLAISVGLAIGLGFIALTMIMAVHNIWIILLACGLVAVGFLIVFFLIKFLFATSKEDRSGYTEVTESSHPELFSFIRRISEETSTAFPKHIYLSHDVNAMVFYDSSFRSLFFPVKKNLVIGLGLVNMSNLSELKAVIAHEFGHFSQKSMKAGSYVYQANKVIYNMLYENKSIADFIDSVSGFHAIVSFCMSIAVRIIQAFQWVLQQAYKSINKMYSGLSRQMEFDADAMAAKVAGSNNSIHMLRRVEFADSCFNATMGCYNEWFAEGYKGKNMYTQQRIIAAFLARKFELPLSNGLPVISDADRAGQDFTRINVKNQWASHPTMKEREQHLAKIALEAPVVDTSPWVLFPDAEKLQEKFTAELYSDVKFKTEVKELNDLLFSEKFAVSQAENSYPAFYKGYYNGRYIEQFDLHADSNTVKEINDVEAFLEERKNGQQQIDAAIRDIETLAYVGSKGSGIRSFDFNGQKYKRNTHAGVAEQIAKEANQIKEDLKESDQQLVFYFLKKAEQVSANNKEELLQVCRKYLAVREMCTDNDKVGEHIAPLISAFYETQDLQRAAQTAQYLKDATPLFVSRIEKVKTLALELLGPEICPFPTDIDLGRIGYMSYTRGDGTFNEANLNEFIGYLNSFNNWNLETAFKMQKMLLEKQLELSGQN